MPLGNLRGSAPTNRRFAFGGVVHLRLHSFTDLVFGFLISFLEEHGRAKRNTVFIYLSQLQGNIVRLRPKHKVALEEHQSKSM
jgi:hypothetical protein